MLRDSDYPLALGALTERLNFRHSGPMVESELDPRHAVYLGEGS